jgi:hypothetical protein
MPQSIWRRGDIELDMEEEIAEKLNVEGQR